MSVWPRASLYTADVTIATVDNNLRFAGQYYDSETGLHYNYHRYYDSKLGRYLRADPMGLHAGVNLYSFVESNPINHSDPFGLSDVFTNPGLLWGDFAQCPECWPSMPGYKPRDPTTSEKFLFDFYADCGKVLKRCAAYIVLGAAADTYLELATKEATKTLVEVGLKAAAKKYAGVVIPGVNVLILGTTVYQLYDCTFQQ